MTRRLAILVLLPALAVTSRVGFPQSSPDAALLGRIEFPTSGAGDARREFLTGVLALHSFWYDLARERFVAAQALDPRFGMAHWGEAMSYDDALGTMTTQADYERLGERAVARMDELDAAGGLDWTERERGYANAVRWRFAAAAAYETRRLRYAEAMEALARQHPEDDEATAFASLALMALPTFDREAPAHVVAVAAPLEEIYERNREHPGVLHYLIHVYDTQTFASLGLRQARLYAGIAPAAPHALHMPSHIFRHLGLWQQVAESNEAAYAASVDWQERRHLPLSTRDFHALEWLLDAYLRLGELDSARRLMAELDAIEAQMLRRGERSTDFGHAAEAMRAYYRSVVPE